MVEEKIRLISSHFSNRLQKMLNNMRESLEYTDVTLVCNDGQVKAHRYVLASSSKVLESLLKKNHKQEVGLPNTAISVDVSTQVLNNLLDYIYKGRTEVPPSQIQAFMAGAEYLKIEGLMNLDDDVDNKWNNERLEDGKTLEDVTDVLEVNNHNMFVDIKEIISCPNATLTNNQLLEEVQLSSEKNSFVTTESFSYIKTSKPSEVEKLTNFDEAKYSAKTENINSNYDQGWNFLSENRLEGVVKCNVCGFNLKGSVSEALQHVKRAHPKAFKTYLQNKQKQLLKFKGQHMRTYSDKYKAYSEKVSQRIMSVAPTIVKKDDFDKERRSVRLLSSTIWEYVEKAEDGWMVCSQCLWTMHSHNSTLVKEHLKMKHPQVYEEYLGKESQAKDIILGKEVPENVPASNSTRYLCPYCVHQNTSESRLNNHIESEHNPVQEYYMRVGENSQCNSCGKLLLQHHPVRLRMHMYVEHRDLLEKLQLEDPDKEWHQDIPKMELERSLERTSFHCDRCSTVFKRQGALKTHIDLLHKGKRHFCSQCGEKFKKGCSLLQHVNAVHKGVRYQCDICGKEMLRAVNLKKHKASTHEGVRFPCPHCDYKATWSHNVKYHIKKVHNL